MKVRVTGAGFVAVNGIYTRQSNAHIPAGFIATCDKMQWPASRMWKQLAVPQDWFLHTDNDSYMYAHVDGRWWMDGPDGAGIYVAPVVQGSKAPSREGWSALQVGVDPMPTVEIESDDQC